MVGIVHHPVCRAFHGGSDSVLEFQGNQHPPESAVFRDDFSHARLFDIDLETCACPVFILPRLQPVRLCDVRLAVLEKTATQTGRTSYRIPINRFGRLFRRPPFIRLQRKTII